MDKIESIKLPIGNHILTTQDDFLVCMDEKSGEVLKVKGNKEQLRKSLIKIANGLKEITSIKLVCFVCGKEFDAIKNREEPTCSNKCRKQKQYMKQKEEQATR
jgi:hypothetical protein